MNAKLTVAELEYTPYAEWKKDFVLLLSMGSSLPENAQPVLDYFNNLNKELDSNNKVHSIIGTRMALPGQISFTQEKMNGTLNSNFPWNCLKLILKIIRSC